MKAERKEIESKVREHIDNYCIKGYSKEAQIVLLANYIESYANHKEESKWISVEDELPKTFDDMVNDSDNVLGYFVSELDNILDVGIMFFRHNTNTWHWDYGDVIKYAKVTHWQPLPTPPKTES